MLSYFYLKTDCMNLPSSVKLGSHLEIIRNREKFSLFGEGFLLEKSMAQPDAHNFNQLVDLY